MVETDFEMKMLIEVSEVLICIGECCLKDGCIVQ
jgi:hypothetical protein